MAAVMRDRQRKGRHVVQMLLDRLFGILGVALEPQSQHHLEGDGKQQQASGDPKCG